MISWRQVASGRDGLRIYRIDAESGNVSFGGSGSKMTSPLDLVFRRFESPTTRYLRETFNAPGSPVGESSFSVACHVVSLPDLLLVTDSTYRTTAGEVFPEVLEAIVESEGRRLSDRPIQALYTHAHFDHSGGHEAVESLGDSVEILAHPHTEALFPLVSRRESFFQVKDVFFRDCEIAVPIESITGEIRQHYVDMLENANVDMSQAPWGSVEDAPMRVDRLIDPSERPVLLAGGRVEVVRFDGHIPGHLCVLVDREHFISGDMWLPATTSLVTPQSIARHAGIPADCCGILRYLESNRELMELPVDSCITYPSHEIIYPNPKRMAMRDLELAAVRVQAISGVLEEHRTAPMRVLDLAWGGADHRSLWKVDGSVFRLVVAHDEASSFVDDLVELGDLQEVEPERYVWGGSCRLADQLDELLARLRPEYGHLDYESRGAAA